MTPIFAKRAGVLNFMAMATCKVQQTCVQFSSPLYGLHQQNHKALFDVPLSQSFVSRVQVISYFKQKFLTVDFPADRKGFLFYDLKSPPSSFLFDQPTTLVTDLKLLPLWHPLLCSSFFFFLS